MPAIVEGNGTETILFLHGFGANKECWKTQIEQLKPYFRVVAVDIPPFGEANKLSCPWALSEYAYCINEVIELIGGKVHIVAHSFGARIVLKMLPSNKRIDKIILTGAAGLKPKFNLLKKLKIINYKILKKIRPNADYSKYGSKDYQSLDEITKQSFVKIVNEHLDSKLKLIDNKTLLIFGRNDNETPLYMAKRFNKKLINSALIVLEDAGHFAFIDKHREFNAIIKDFLLT